MVYVDRDLHLVVTDAEYHILNEAYRVAVRSPCQYRRDHLQGDGL